MPLHHNPPSWVLMIFRMWLLTQSSRCGGDGEGVGESNTLIIMLRLKLCLKGV